MRAVVFLLIGDIVDDRVFVRLAYRKSSITFLPGKITIIQISTFYPLACVGFNIANEVGQPDCGRQACQNMDMIRSAANHIGMPRHGTNSTPYIMENAR